MQNFSADASFSTQDNPTIYDLELKLMLMVNITYEWKNIEYINEVIHVSIVLFSSFSLSTFSRFSNK